ncbi:MAG: transcription repressor NadR [Lachnospiraceae bacterium]|nr:transcription repressor NadR [Lachnospiraceae bacterium]
MEGEERRKLLVELLTQSTVPVSGSELAQKLKVSRQVVVQDIALLRASNRNIISTNKGYLLYSAENRSSKCRRTYFVSHDDAGMEEELNTVVDNGGKLLDVVVDHEIYGQITVDLLLDNRREVREFMEKINSGTARPLNVLTNGKHYHTVEADSETILDQIEEELKKKKYLILLP